MSQTIMQPTPAWQVMLDGKDLTAKLAPRLLSLSLAEDRAEKADTLELTLHDDDGAMVLPPEGARLTVAFGWAKGAGVTLGLVNKGSFVVDEVRFSGPPDTVTISARSADFAGAYRKRKNRSHHGQTLGAIVALVARDNGLKASCHADLAPVVVTAAEQAHKSDMEFLRDLGRRYDAIATVKAGTLIFAPVNARTTASGKAIPSFTLTRRKADHVDYHRAARDGAQDGAEAQYYDQDSAARKTVSTPGTHRKRLKKVYASQADARAAANSERNRLARAAATMSFTLALGDARIGANTSVTVTGCKSEINKRAWRVTSVRHELDGQRGFTTALEMEGV
jgi:phage protein D